MESTQTVKWSLNEEEVGYYIGKDKIDAKSSQFKIFIPKILPTEELGKEKEQKEFISSACFCNASDCMPKVGSTVTTSNYILLSPQDNSGFKNPLLKPNAKVVVKCVGKSLDQLYLSNEKDESVTIEYKGGAKS